MSGIEKVSEKKLMQIRETALEFQKKLKSSAELEIGGIYLMSYYGYHIIKIKNIEIEDRDHHGTPYQIKTLSYAIYDLEEKIFKYKEGSSHYWMNLDDAHYHSIVNKIENIQELLDNAQLYYDGKKDFVVEEDKLSDENSSSLMTFSNKDTYVNLQKSIEERRDQIELVKASVQLLVQEQMNKVEAIKKKMEAQIAIFSKQLTKLFKVIATLELYAGINEELVQISEGVPASSETPLTIRQGMCYFDEELADPRLNDNQGLSFRDLGSFWEWLIDSGHFKVMLPEKRCMVACRVRRERRKHDIKDLADAFKAASEDELDMSTYLLIRNGDNVYYVSTTNINFYGKTFPPKKQMLFLQEAMRIIAESGVERLRDLMDSETITEERVVSIIGGEKDGQTEIKKEKKTLYSWVHEELREVLGSISEHQSINGDTDVSSSDSPEKAVEKLDEKMFNYKMRFALFQGLIDRANIFTFPERVSVFDPKSQEKYIKLVYDDEIAFPSHRMPFKEWRKEIDKTIDYGSRILIAWGRSKWDYKGDQSRFDDRFNSYSSSDFDRTPDYPNDGMYIVEKLTKEISEDAYEGKKYWSSISYIHDKFEKDGKYYANFMIIKYNPGDEVGWGGWGRWDDIHQRKNRLSFRILPSDNFVINYDQVERDTVEFYMNDRINRRGYVDMMPFLNGLRQYLLKEEKEEELFSTFILEEIRRNHKDLDRFTESELLPQIKEDIDWYKYKNQLKRPVTKEEDKAYRMIMRRWKSREGMVKDGDTLAVLVDRHLKRSGQNKEL